MRALANLFANIDLLSGGIFSPALTPSEPKPIWKRHRDEARSNPARNAARRAKREIGKRQYRKQVLALRRLAREEASLNAPTAG